MRRVVIQIGLHQTAEYAYLAYPDWRELSDTFPEINRLPKDLFNGDWFDYYGIDADIYSVMHCLESFKYQNIHFVSALIHTESQKGLSLVQSWFEEVQYWTPAVTLNEVFEKAGGVDVLVVDIESYEKPLFESYDWRFKPTFISVECHTPDIVESLKPLFESQSYQLYREERTNIGVPRTPEGTIELQFIL